MWKRMPTSGRPSPLGAGAHNVGKFGPQVEIVSVTVVAPAPAAIVAGLNAQPVNTGWPEHPKLTVELKAAPAAGAAENV
jgi:hypothetical protein